MVAAALALVAAVGALLWPPPADPGRRVGLFTTLPLMWSEGEDIAALLRPEAEPHWARRTLEAQATLVPLDAIADHGDAGTVEPLRGVGMLVMAQPRPLSPQENVALDRWVRGGGKVLLFADPLLTAHSEYALGDRRRPQDVVLLSPILKRWGLDLQFDDEQPAGQRLVEAYGIALPVELPGVFALARGSACTIAAAGLAATCRVGRGKVTAIADATLFDAAPSAAGDREKVLAALLERAGR